jgi:hypothetical protein
MFETDIKNLASVIVAEALKEGTPFQDRLEALKILNTYYGLTLKNKAPDDAGQAPMGPSFLDFSEAVAGGSPRDSGAEEKPNGGSKTIVRTGARRRGTSGLQHSSGDI